MKMIVLVLNNIKKLDNLLVEFSKNGLKGATIINSTGMAHSLYGTNSTIMSSLKILLENDNKENKTIFSIVDDKQEKIFNDCVLKVIGSLSEPNTGISFTIPIESVNGIIKN